MPWLLKGGENVHEGANVLLVKSTDNTKVTGNTKLRCRRHEGGKDAEWCPICLRVTK